MKMANVFPLFKKNMAVACCELCVHREARELYGNGEMSRQAPPAPEETEIRSFVERLKWRGMGVHAVLREEAVRLGMTTMRRLFAA